MLPKVWQNIQFIQRIEIPHVCPHWTIYFLVRVVSKRDEQEGSVQQAHGETFEPVKPWIKKRIVPLVLDHTTWFTPEIDAIVKGGGGRE